MGWRDISVVFITFITVLTLFIFILGISLDRDVCSDNENDNNGAGRVVDV